MAEEFKSENVEKSAKDFKNEKAEELTEELARKAVRLKLDNSQNISAGFGLIAALGGVIIIPILLGLWAGIFLDEHYPVTFSWRLSLTFCGFAWCMVNAYFWVKTEHEKIAAAERELQGQIDKEMKKNAGK